MKKIILPLLILTFPFIGLSAQIKSFNWDGINYRLVKDSVNGINNQSAMVINLGNDNYKGDIVIPSSVMHNGVGYPVTAIDNMAFRCCKQLTSITIPSSVVEIPAAAFYGCYNLRTIVVSDDNNKYDSRDNCNAVIETATNTLIASCENTVVPQSVSALGDCAFFGNKSINSSLTIDGRFEKIGRWVFLDCEHIETLNWNSPLPLTPVTELLKSSLKEVVLGNTVSSISDFAFTDCKNLESIYIPSTVNVIGADAFKGCSRLKSITIPSGVKEIGSNAFDMCDNIETLYWNSNGNLRSVLQPLKSTLNTIVIGDSVTSLDVSSFSDCKNIISVSVSPGNPVYDSRNNCNTIIESVSNKVILGCKTSTIPEGVTAIDESAFSYCSSPKTISLPSTLLSIADYAFRDCDSLTTLVIPANVHRIGSMIVNGCQSLTSLSVDPANTFFDSRNNCNAVIEKRTGRLIVGCNTSTVPSGVTAIAAFSFSGYKHLKSVNCPSSLRVIEDYAFNNCISLESVSLPSNMDSIGEYAFSNCKSLLSIRIPSGIKTIETGAFQMCETLASVDMQPGVVEIGDRAFYGCRSIKSLSVPTTVKAIGLNVFSGCSGIQTAGPKGGGYDYEFCWDTIPASAFMGLSGLRSVYIPKTVKAIYEGIPPGNSYAGYVGEVFYGCDNLETVTASFKDTKLIRLNKNPQNWIDIRHLEQSLDYNLYKRNPVKNLTLLDDSIISLATILTDKIKNVTLSDNVKYIEPGAFDFEPYSYTDITYDEYNGHLYSPPFKMESNIENIFVESGNSRFSSIDGVLFNKNGSILLNYPQGRTGGYYIPESTITVASFSFRGCNKMRNVVFSRNVRQIEERAFENCSSLKWVKIEGLPQIGKNAFIGCHNIESVTTHSSIPGLMDINDVPQTIAMRGHFEDSSGSIIVTPKYNSEISRVVSEINSYQLNWETNLILDSIPAGKYKLSIGVLPSSDNKPSYFHPAIVRTKLADDYGRFVLDTIYNPQFFDQRRRKLMDINYSNDVSGYDSVLIDTIIIPSATDEPFMLRLKSKVDRTNQTNYSKSMVIDRIFFEPIDNDFPEEVYAGPFTGNAFNNAILYVPKGAVDTYKTANGWKLFKNIAVDTSVKPILKDNDNSKSGNLKIYDITGRRVKAESIEQLAPGIYIIDNQKYLVR